MKTIELTKGKVAIIDDEDLQLVSKYSWHAKKSRRTWYAVTNIWIGSRRTGRQCQTIFMHRLICNAPKGRCVDHRNYDGLDNRRSNLRVCNYSENSIHSKKSKSRSTSSQFKGVSWVSSYSRWQANIRVCGKSKTIGRYKSETEAAYAYDMEALRFFGEYAALNLLGGDLICIGRSPVIGLSEHTTREAARKHREGNGTGNG